MSSDPLLVAAIDFGTTFSGYAFSFRHEYGRDPLKISANNWIAGSQSLVSLKTPTTILLDPQQKFHSFGYEAENKYFELVENDQHQQWFFFSRFKMMLHKNESLRRSTTIKDENGHIMPAQKIFMMAIQYLKNHLLESIHSKVVNMENDLIRWVVTVPAIWDNGAKQFMREAAEQAGIRRDQLRLALEPEAASIYCNHVPTEMVATDQGQLSSSTFKKGTRYMVVDLGGGTVDITVHEVQRNDSLREIHKATGGAWGGTKVDATFYKFLVKLFGIDVLNKLKEKHMDDYQGIFRDFETKKRKIKPVMDGKIMIKIPYFLLEVFHTSTGKTFAEALPASPYSSSVAIKGDKLQVQSIVFQNFFSEVVQGIVEHVQDVLSTCTGTNITKILLVGGFSESEMIVHTLKETFPDKKIVSPQDPGLAVLKGAVLFGHKPLTISSRISQYTYGFEVFDPFIEGKHPECFRVIRPDGDVKCKNVFEKYVEIGEEIPVGRIIEQSFTPSEEDAIDGIAVIASTSKSPCYITDKSCRKLGSIVIQRPNCGWTEGSQLHVSMEFGGTEFTVKIFDDCLGNTYTHSYDFLK